MDDKKSLKGYLSCVPAVLIIAAWVYFLNRKVHISWLFIDDLYIWDSFVHETFTGFVFPLGTHYFRPVTWAVIWLVLRAAGDSLQLVIFFNLFLLAAAAVLLFFFMRRLSGSRLLSLFLSLMFVSSRFSYYNVTQIFGIMEALAMLFTILLSVFLYDFLHGKGYGSFYAALFLYLLASFTHERYMVLLPMFYYVLAVRKPKSGDTVLAGILAMSAFLLIQFARLRFIGTLLPRGTGGTEVVEAFSGKTFAKNVLCELCYLFGFNAGPIHLNGVPWSDTPLPVRILLAVFAALVFRTSFLFIRDSIRRKDRGWFADLVYFAGFIIGLVTASSVSIRVEMRWLYTSFAFCAILLAYMNRRPEKDSFPENRREIPVTLLLSVAASLIMTGCDLYYRANSKDLYLNEEQHRHESLIGCTLGQYGEAVYDMTVYIVGNTFSVTEFEEEHFHQPGRLLEKPLTIRHIASEDEIPAGEQNVIILYEDPVRDIYVAVPREQAF